MANNIIDFNLYSVGILKNHFDMALQELDILFSTEPTELIGEPNYGMNFERFLWELIPSPELLENYIKEKIQTSTLFVNEFKYDVHAEALQDISETIYVVKINLYQNNDESVEKTYIIKYN